MKNRIEELLIAVNQSVMIQEQTKADYESNRKRKGTIYNNTMNHHSAKVKELAQKIKTFGSQNLSTWVIEFTNWGVRQSIEITLNSNINSDEIIYYMENVAYVTTDYTPKIEVMGLYEQSVIRIGFPRT